MSQRQRRRLRCLRLLSPWNFAALWAGNYSLDWFTTAINRAILSFQNQEWHAFFSAAVTAVMPVLIMLIIILFLIERWLKLTQDIQAGRVIQRQGKVEHQQHWNLTRTSMTFLIAVEGQEHPVMPWQQSAFKQGKDYRVYVAPTLNMIVAAELRSDATD